MSITWPMITGIVCKERLCRHRFVHLFLIFPVRKYDSVQGHHNNGGQNKPECIIREQYPDKTNNARYFE
jgi:hypothetical protein